MQESTDKGNSRFLVRSNVSEDTVQPRAASMEGKTHQPRSLYLVRCSSKTKAKYACVFFLFFVFFFRYRQTKNSSQADPPSNKKGSSRGRKKVTPGRIQDLDKGMISARKGNYMRKCDLFLTISVQFSSFAQSCPTLCDPMNHSTPGLAVHHQLLEFTQTHVHRVSDATYYLNTFKR